MPDRSKPGPLIAIGGGEDKENDRVVLREVADRVKDGRLVIATVGSRQREGLFEAYQRAFADLCSANLVELYVNDRSDAHDADKLELLDGAAGVFFSGGDQLRIASQIGDTPIEQRIRSIHKRGGVIAGTSAGAAVMSQTMLIGGASAESHRIGDLHMAPGLGFIADAIIDQHFAQRGRIGRLLGAVAHNPRNLGIGIDEDTAILVQGKRFQVVGLGAVYVVDAEGITKSNIADGQETCVLSLHDVRLHVLSAGDKFDIARRAPISAGSGRPLQPFAAAS